MDDLSSENEKLRARLNALQADRPGSTSIIEATQPVASTSQTPLPTVDRRYLTKVHLDLQHYRQVLISKEHELEREKFGLPEPDTLANIRLSDLQLSLTRSAADLSILRAEHKSIQTIIKNLRVEKEHLAEYRNRITREVDARMAIKQINGVTEGAEDAKKESEVEKTLRQVTAWIDETIDKWETVSASCDESRKALR